MISHKEKIDKLITLEKENNLWNHILSNLFHRGKTIADKKSKEYIIWTSNYWVGTFYPIFKINFNEKQEISKIETELSPYGKFWLAIVIIAVLIFSSIIVFIPIIEYIDDFGLREIIMLVVYTFLMYSLYWVFKKIYSNEKKYLINELKVIVGLETQENIDKIEDRKNEWTFKMTLFRIFAYPFSIFVLLMSMFYMLPNGDLKGIVGILFAGAYLYTVIKILWNKRKKTKANNV